MKINFHGRKFRGITNTPGGQVSSDTLFHYTQVGNLLAATYRGGSIKEGHMMGAVRDDSSLYFTYHHIDMDGLLKSGYCTSVAEVLPDGRIRLYEKWEWTHGGPGKGESVVEEIKI